MSKNEPIVIVNAMQQDMEITGLQVDRVSGDIIMSYRATYPGLTHHGEKNVSEVAREYLSKRWARVQDISDEPGSY